MSQLALAAGPATPAYNPELSHMSRDKSVTHVPRQDTGTPSVSADTKFGRDHIQRFVSALTRAPQVCADTNLC
jgi:hypothetical protein